MPIAAPLRRLAAALLLVAASPAIASSAPPPGIDAYVADMLKEFGAPALSLAIVEDGRVILAKAYGVRKLGTDEKVDEHAAFPIGSETKAFTAAALAILVDRHKLAWDDRVVDRLPGFRMYDPYATANMTIRDLLTHRSGLGLGEGDLLIIPRTNRSRADIVHALRYLKPATGFRESFAYDNILYIVAGALVEAVSGQSWEDFVTRNIFVPAGMKDAHPDYDARAANAVSLHARTGGPVRGLGEETVLQDPLRGVVAPAGGINASALDMAAWMNIQLARGALPNGKHLFSTTQSEQMWRPVVVVPPDEFQLPAELAGMQPQMQDYALGWFVDDYHGHVVVEHAGAVLGGIAMQYLIPEKHVGISVAVNSEDNGARRAVMFRLLDHYLGLPQTDWASKLKVALDARLQHGLAAVQSRPDQAAGGQPPPLPLAAYAGRYVDPWYGPITISLAAPGRLAIAFDRSPGMSGSLQPVAGNRFRADWTDKTIEAAYVDFVTRGGAVASISMRAVSPLADFSFDYQDLAFLPVSR